ncbi:MAG: hypothetical protein AAGC54_11695 [Cyanobacteria bacterium P01_F01_bin.4]
MSPNSVSEIAYITAAPSEAIEQLNQLVCRKQAEQLMNQAKTPLFSKATLQVRSLVGFLRVMWYALFLEEEGIRQQN